MVLVHPSEYLPVTKTYNDPTYLYDYVSAAITLPDVPPQVFRPIGEDVTAPLACKACSTTQRIGHQAQSPNYVVYCNPTYSQGKPCSQLSTSRSIKARIRGDKCRLLG